MSKGFVRKSRAPPDSARCFASTVTSAVTTRTGNQRPSNQGFSCASTSKPSGSGMWRSRISRSGGCCAHIGTTLAESIVLSTAV